MDKPSQLETPDFDALKKVCAEYMDEVADPDIEPDEDFHQYIFEAAIEALYGRDVWDYINNS